MDDAFMEWSWLLGSFAPRFGWLDLAFPSLCVMEPKGIDLLYGGEFCVAFYDFNSTMNALTHLTCNGFRMIARILVGGVWCNYCYYIHLVIGTFVQSLKCVDLQLFDPFHS